MFNSEEKALCLNSEDLRQAREGKGFPRAGASVKVVSHKPDICPAISLFGIPCPSNPARKTPQGQRKTGLETLCGNSRGHVTSRLVTSTQTAEKVAWASRAV